MFAKYGPVSDVYIPVDYYTRRCRGFAYVQYPCVSLLSAALLSLLFVVTVFIRRKVFIKLLMNCRVYHAETMKF